LNPAASSKLSDYPTHGQEDEGLKRVKFTMTQEVAAICFLRIMSSGSWARRTIRFAVPAERLNRGQCGAEMEKEACFSETTAGLIQLRGQRGACDAVAGGCCRLASGSIR
jgi:hypothetical protein